LDRFPRLSSETNGGFAELLLRHDETGWKLVYLETDLAAESAVAKEMFAIDFRDLGIVIDPQSPKHRRSRAASRPERNRVFDKAPGRLSTGRRDRLPFPRGNRRVDAPRDQRSVTGQFLYNAKRKATGATIEKLSGEEVTTYQQNGVTFVTTLKPVAKAVVTFDDESNPKLVASTHLLGLKAGEYRIVTAKIQK